ncbi:hypothetical protein ACJMK2_007266, partial [Sinanodonta woodiana]
MTTRFRTDKRASSDLDLFDQSTVHLRRGSCDICLNLKRNHVRKKDVRFSLVNVRILKKE